MVEKVKEKGFEIGMIVLAAVLLVYLLLPFLGLLANISRSDLAAGLAREEVQMAIFRSISTATATVLICLAFGTPLAYLLARRDFKGKTLINILVLLPLIIPPTIAGVLLLTVFGPNTPFGGLSADAGTPLTLSYAGIVLAQVFVASPFYIIFARSSFESTKKGYEDAARILGKTKFQTYLRVSLPLARKGIVVGATLAWLRAMGELGATMMMAYNPHTISIQIWEDTFVGGNARALPTVVIITIITVFLILLLTRFGKWTGVMSGKGGD